MRHATKSPCDKSQSYLMGAGGVCWVCHAAADVRACGARERARAGAGDTGDTYLKQHDAICPSRRRPLFPISGTTLRLCGPPMMAKTVLDLLHSLGVDDADIRFDNFGG